MKITPKLLHIPPFISTSWDQIISLYLQPKGGSMQLMIALKEGAVIEIPHLPQTAIDEIFQAHANFSESSASLSNLLDSSLNFSIPMKLDASTIDSLATQLQHNPNQANLPPIPMPILSKILTILRSLGTTEEMFFEKPLEDCYCTYCQLAKTALAETEEVVALSELTFRDWEVAQKDTKLYHVTNPLDAQEYYTVFLGDPLGCTCGSKNCEHIRAVLRT